MTFVDEGDRQLKNIERPVKVYSISQDGESTALQLGAMVDAGTRPVVAILPFSNMGTAGEDDYFADGLTEDIITALSRFRELLVIARNSTFRFKNQAVDVSSVGRELNAGYVLEGSIRRAASRVRITAQLIRVSDGTHVWADRYDRNIEDIFDVQDEVTQTIAANLGVRLQDAAREQAMRKNHADLNAYDCVLRSRRFTQTLVASEHSNARDLLEKAIKLDPQKAYARIWLAIIHFFRHENEGFYKEAERALALNPHDPEILAEAGHYYTFVGDYERGAELTQRAIVLNPLHPGWYHFSFARKYLRERNYASAIADVRKINLPGFYWCWLIKASAFGHLGETAAAADSLIRLENLEPGFSAIKELGKWNTQPDDLAVIVEGLNKVGYVEPESTGK